MAHRHPSPVTSHCPECAARSYARNHYFTGKLLVERDFTDEQHYFMEKIRIHHQRLHGAGVVCGLQIVQHPNEDCRDRYVVLQPGSAVDCCGHDIMVVEPDTISLKSFPAVQALEEDPDDQDHTLQLCIRYRECPAEEIPVLYDECGCDDTRCAPNRILESYEIDIVVDPPPPPVRLFSPRFSWQCTASLAHAAQVVLHEPSRRMFVLTADDAATVYQVSTDNLVVEASTSLGRKGLSMAVAPDGALLYVAAEATTNPATNDAELLIFDVTADIGLGPARQADISSSAGSGIVLACASDGRLVGLIKTGGKLRVWAAGVADPATLDDQTDIAADLDDLAFNSTGTHVYMAEPGSTFVHHADLSSSGLPTVKLDLTGVDPWGLALVSSTSADRLAVIDKTSCALHLVNPAGSGSVDASVSLDYPPDDVVVTTGGHWAFVLEHNGDESYLQAVNLQRLRQGAAVVPSAPFQVGDLSSSEVITASGEHLFVPFVGDPNADNAGGVAVVKVAELDCEALLSTEQCPDCATGDCLVLATVEGYRPDRSLWDMPDPPPDPTADAAADIARIDNLKGRVWLPSTQAIAEALACLIEHGCAGGAGTQGLPGLDGKPGKDGKDGKDGLDGKNGQDGNDGKDGEGLEEGLTQIRGLSWKHATSGNSLATVERLNGTIDTGVVISFTAKVRADTVDAEHVLQVLIRQPDLQLICRCAVPGEVIPVDVTGTSQDVITKAKETTNPLTLAVAFIADRELARKYFDSAPEHWVTLRGDFVLDEADRAIDAEHVRASLPTGLPTGDRPASSSFGIQGGTFDSWFSLGEHPGSDLVAINRSSLEELTGVGLSADVAAAVIARRETHGPFTKIDDLLKVNGLGQRTLARIREHITLD